MPRPIKFAATLIICAPIALSACDRGPALPENAGYGPNPQLPEPHPTPSWWPFIKIADAVGWKTGETPKAAQGFTVNAFASGLEHPRFLYELPNGDILVSEADAPPNPKSEGIRGFVQGLVMKRAGSHKASPNKIVLLRDENGEGVAKTRSDFLVNLNSPFGVALIGDKLYVANADALLRFNYAPGATQITDPGEKVADLPGDRNHHWTKSLVANKDGSKLYVGVGSNSNAAEHGMEEEANRAAILEVDPTNGAVNLYASGLRNPAGLDWNPVSGALWAAVNERDEIGDNLVPDYMTSVKKGGFYGWPYSYYGQHLDPRVEPQNPELVAKAIKPDYALGSHTASLGFCFVKNDGLGSGYKGGAIIGQHGSWNRDPRAGYRVIFVPFSKGAPSGEPKEILTGFLNEKGEARGRPVGVLVDRRGDLLVADDVGNAVWRVRATTAAAAR